MIEDIEIFVPGFQPSYFIICSLPLMTVTIEIRQKQINPRNMTNANIEYMSALRAFKITFFVLFK